MVDLSDFQNQNLGHENLCTGVDIDMQENKTSISNQAFDS